MSFVYFWNEVLMERKTGVTCPEVPERLNVLNPRTLFAKNPEIGTQTFAPKDESILSLVHSKEYICFVKTAFETKRRALDSGDTRVTKDTFEQALLSASAGCAALDMIFSGQIQRAFCAIRPPGHHANRVRALGFCVFNNGALAARYAQRHLGAQRVLIVDWDVHPGNGAQEIFWEDPSVFTLSFHQEGLLGESGDERFIGENEGLGFNKNVTFPAETSGEVYVPRFRQVLSEVVGSFRPDLVIISAGFDAHERDLVANLKLTENDYSELTGIVRSEALRFSRGRVLSLLEGGYNISALRNSVFAHVIALHRA